MILEQNNEMLEAARENFNQGNFQVAQDMLQQLLLSDATNPEVFHLLACIYYRQGKIKKSVKFFRRALDIDPSFTDATVGLSMVLNDTGRYDEAKKVFDTGQEQARRQKESHRFDAFFEEQVGQKHRELGDIYFQYERYDEATEQYFEAYKYSHEKLEIRMRIIDCFMKRNEVARAIKELRLLLQEKPAFAPARLKLGWIYFQNNQVLEAVEQWESILLRDPDHPEALKYLRMAQGRQTTDLEL